MVHGGPLFRIYPLHESAVGKTPGV